AMIDIETLNKELSLDLPISEDYESLGGLITTELSRVCIIGDEVILGDVRLEVKELDKMRISRVLLEKIVDEEK
ncbi:MAG: transporter associated domain-containing protein, partial [Fusobacteriaceae bacterium]